jgi:thiamine biosynthesis lipoprotein
MRTWLSRTLLLVTSLATLAAASAEPMTFAGPAMGTTYRIRMARSIEGKSLGVVHRKVDRLLEQLDHALSTWRDDSDISRLNRAPAGEWVPIHACLFDILTIAKQLHQQTDGRFDVTVAPLVHWWAEQERLVAAPASAAIPPDILQITGMKLISLRRPTANRPAAARKEHSDTAIDLNSIGPGYAVDQIGELLLRLGSTAHLVELGGEVRGWGNSPGEKGWLIHLNVEGLASPSPQTIRLAAGRAVAVAAWSPQRPVIDPRTGSRIWQIHTQPATAIFAPTCAEADALATASLIPK